MDGVSDTKEKEGYITRPVNVNPQILKDFQKSKPDLNFTKDFLDKDSRRTLLILSNYFSHYEKIQAFLYLFMVETMNFSKHFLYLFTVETVNFQSILTNLFSNHLVGTRRYPGEWDKGIKEIGMSGIGR